MQTFDDFFQARNALTKEVVAIKKMSYVGKQSAEVFYLPFRDEEPVENLCLLPNRNGRIS